MTRTLLAACLLACALPASASAGSLSIANVPDSTYSRAKATVTTTISGTADPIPMGESGQDVYLVPDPTGGACAATVTAEQKRVGTDGDGAPPSYPEMPGPFSQQVSIDLYNVATPSTWKLCGYLTNFQGLDSPPAAAASTNTFTLTDPKIPTGTGRAGFSFIVSHPRAAKPTMTLHPGDALWLGGSFGYEENQWACAGPDNKLFWISDAFEGSRLHSHGSPALAGETDSMSGLTLKTTLSKHLKPGKYAIQLACADGSLATVKRYLTITAKKSRRHKR